MTEATASDLGFASLSEAVLDVDQAHRIAAVFDQTTPPGVGDPLPLLWHWAFFTPTAPTGALGPDGHPHIAPGGPTEGLPRRMFAGGRVRQYAPLLVGAPAQRRTRLLRADRKEGRSGTLLVVTVEHVLTQHGRTVLEEENDLVYRSAGGTVPAPGGDGVPDTPPGGFVRSVAPNPVLLFRFSAITFNSHRIHYDSTYATEIEGYPALVVHGPLTAMLLAGAASEHLGRPLERFEFRATAPLFVTARFHLVGSPDGEGLRLEARRGDGETAMTAMAF